MLWRNYFNLTFLLLATLGFLSCRLTNIYGSAGVRPPGEPIKPSISNQFASLKVNTQPPGCKVYLDYEYVGGSPLELQYLQPGRHFLKITLTGYKDYEATITLKKGREKSVNIEMKSESKRHQVNHQITKSTFKR